MIFRVEASPALLSRMLRTGSLFPRTQVTKGLPRGARFFHAYPNPAGNWFFLFEGKPEEGLDVEGEVRDFRIEFTSIYGDDTPLPLPLPKESL